MRNKIHDIRFLNEQIMPEIFTISETKLDQSFPSSQFMIDGYHNPNELRKDRNAYGGGLITYIKNGIPFKRLTKIEPSLFEITCIEVTFGKRKWGYVSVYRPPSASGKVFFENLSKCIEKLTNIYENIIIIGDINVNTKDNKHHDYRHYDNFIDTFGLKNLIKTNTCYMGGNVSPSSIDVMLTNCPRSFFHTHTVSTGISDCHVLTGSFLKSTYRRSEPIEIEYRNYKKLHSECTQFMEEIKNIEIPSENEDPNLLFEQYQGKFRKILDKYAPIRRKKLRGNDGGFADKELRKAWYTRSRLRNKYIKNKTPGNWELYRRQRNHCTTLKRNAKNNHFRNKTNDSESFWKIFGPFITNKGHHTQEDYILSIDQKLENNKDKVSNAFNQHYVNIIENTTGKKPEKMIFSDSNFSKIDQIIDKYKDHPSVQIIQNKIENIENFTNLTMAKPTPAQIKDIIKELKTKSSQGWDKIPPKIVKLCADVISEPL